jgi:hypothetical protein
LDTENESRAEVDASVQLRGFGFQDVHPLWGGRSLWAKEDLSAEVWVVDATQRKRRFGLTLTAETWAEIERLVGETGLLSAVMPERNGVSDEGRPSIMLMPESGETVVRAKWANDRVEAFDRVYERLLAIAGGARD